MNGQGGKMTERERNKGRDKGMNEGRKERWKKGMNECRR
jgi:hypothetical protein